MNSVAARLEIDGTAAALGPAQARDLLDIGGEAVVYGEFLPWMNHPAAHVEDVPLEIPGAQVGLAAMIDDLCAAAAHCAVEGPVVVQSEEIRQITSAAALGLAAADLLSRVLDHLPVGWYLLNGI